MLGFTTTFVGAMALVSILGIISIWLFPVRIGIAISVIVFGLAIASNARIYNSLIYAAVVCLASFMDMPMD